MAGSNIESLGNAFLALLREHVALFSLESSLASQSLLPFFLSLTGIVLFTLSTWVGLLALAVYAVYTLSQNIAITIIVLIVIQLSALVSMIAMMKAYLDRLKFKQTRAHLKLYFGAEHE